MPIYFIIFLLLPLLFQGCIFTSRPSKDKRVYLFDTSYFANAVFGESFHKVIEQVEIYDANVQFARFEIDSSRGSAEDTLKIDFDRMGYLEVGNSRILSDTIMFTPEAISVERDSGSTVLNLIESERIPIPGKGIPRKFIISTDKKELILLQSDSTVFRRYFLESENRTTFGVLKPKF